MVDDKTKIGVAACLAGAVASAAIMKVFGSSSKKSADDAEQAASA